MRGLAPRKQTVARSIGEITTRSGRHQTSGGSWQRQNRPRRSATKPQSDGLLEDVPAHPRHSEFQAAMRKDGLLQAPLQPPREPRDARSSTCRLPPDAPIPATKRQLLGRRLKQIRTSKPSYTLPPASSTRAPPQRINNVSHCYMRQRRKFLPGAKRAHSTEGLPRICNSPNVEGRRPERRDRKVLPRISYLGMTLIYRTFRPTNLI